MVSPDGTFDFTQYTSADGILTAVGAEKADHPLGLLERLNKAVEQNAIAVIVLWNLPALRVLLLPTWPKRLLNRGAASAASGVHEDADKQLSINDGAVFAARDRFLLTPNKVDWKATPAMSLSDLEFVAEYVPPRNKIERWAATRCEEVLFSMTAKLRIVWTITTRGAIIHENPADIFNPTSTVDRI